MSITVKMAALATIATALVVGASSADAAWKPAASGNAAAKAGALAPATFGSGQGASVSGGTVTITWTNGSNPTGTVYVVKRGSTTVCSLASSPCTDTPGNGTFTYSVAPLLGTNWSAASISANATVASTGLTVTGLGGSTSGNIKVNFRGTGATPGTNVVVRVCSTNTQCTSAAQVTATPAVAPASDGSWTTAVTGGNLNTGTTYWAFATQATSPVRSSSTFQFDAP